jgi:nitrogen regulatory protein PII
MREVKAYIQKYKLDDVIRALRKIEGLSGLSIIESCGYGIGWNMPQNEGQTNFRSGIKLEIVCRNDLVEAVVATVEKAAHTGLRGDGKIYVSSIEQAVRISTGERGEKAV